MQIAYGKDIELRYLSGQQSADRGDLRSLPNEWVNLFDSIVSFFGEQLQVN